MNVSRETFNTEVEASFTGHAEKRNYPGALVIFYALNKT